VPKQWVNRHPDFAISSIEYYLEDIPDDRLL
jgi:hypothetical protein